MSSKKNEQGPGWILLCSDQALMVALRITDLYGYGDGLECISWDFGAGEGGGGCECFGEDESDESGKYSVLQ